MEWSKELALTPHKFYFNALFGSKDFHRRNTFWTRQNVPSLTVKWEFHTHNEVMVHGSDLDRVFAVSGSLSNDSEKQDEQLQLLWCTLGIVVQKRHF